MRYYILRQVRFAGAHETLIWWDTEPEEFSDYTEAEKYLLKNGRAGTLYRIVVSHTLVEVRTSATLHQIPEE